MQNNNGKVDKMNFCEIYMPLMLLLLIIIVAYYEMKLYKTELKYMSETDEKYRKKYYNLLRENIKLKVKGWFFDVE